MEALEFLLNIAAQPTDVVDVGAHVSENGLYGIITILGLTTAAGWGLAIRLLLKHPDAINQLHAEYQELIQSMREGFQASFEKQADKNVAVLDSLAVGVTELRHSVDRNTDKMTDTIAEIRDLRRNSAQG